MQNELKIENMKSNISYAMAVHNIGTYSELAKIIGVAPTTWNSFLKNLNSKSSAKTAFCKHFNITVHQFEEELLSEIWTKDTSAEKSRNKDIESPILSLSDEEIYTKFISSNEDSIDDELSILKKEVIEKYKMLFNSTISRARYEISKGKTIEAWNEYNSAWWLLTPNDLSTILESDLQNYIFLCKKMHNDSCLNKLINKLLLPEFYNNKLLILFSTLLKLDYPEFEKMCLMALLDE